MFNLKLWIIFFTIILELGVTRCRESKDTAHTFVPERLSSGNQAIEGTSEKSPPPSREESDKTNETESLAKKIEELTKQNTELQDKYMRSLAECENVRQRMSKQVEESRIYGIQNFCKDLVEVADVLTKATESVPKEEVSDKNRHLKNLYEGLVLTESQLKKVFRNHGLIAINPLNQKFDPNIHEALFQQEVEGKEPGIVVVVSKIGYMLHNRCVRPAVVGVSKAHSKSHNATSTVETATEGH